MIGVRNLLLCVSLVPAMAAAHAALGQEIGSAKAGYDLAREVCSRCHAVEPDAPVSPDIGAPPFIEIADDPSRTPMALSVWFRSPHPTMPDLVLSADEVSDLLAYFAALRDR